MQVLNIGSHAKARATLESDIDLLYVRSKKPSFLTLEKYQKLKRFLKKELGYTIDLLPEQSLHPLFQKQIAKEKIRIF